MTDKHSDPSPAYTNAMKALQTKNRQLKEESVLQKTHYEAQLADLREQLRQTSQDSHYTHNKTEKHMAQLQKTISQQQNQIDQLTDSLAHQQTRNTQLEAQLVQLQSDYKAISQEQMHSTDDNKQIIQSMHQKNNSLKEENKEMVQQVNILKQQLLEQEAVHQRSQRVLNEKVQKTKQEMTTLEENKTQQFTNINHILQEKEIQIKQLSADNKRIIKELKQEISSYDEIKTSFEAIKEQMSQKDGQLMKLQQLFEASEYEKRKQSQLLKQAQSTNEKLIESSLEPSRRPLTQSQSLLVTQIVETQKEVLAINQALLKAKQTEDSCDRPRIQELAMQLKNKTDQLVKLKQQEEVFLS